MALTERDRIIADAHRYCGCAGIQKTTKYLDEKHPGKFPYRSVYACLHKPAVIEYLSVKAQAAEQIADLTDEIIVEENRRIAHSNIKEYYNEDGSPKTVVQLTKTQAAAVMGWREQWRTWKDKDGKIIIDEATMKPITVCELHPVFWSKPEALKNEYQHHKLINPPATVTNNYLQILAMVNKRDVPIVKLPEQIEGENNNDV